MSNMKYILMILQLFIVQITFIQSCDQDGGCSGGGGGLPQQDCSFCSDLYQGQCLTNNQCPFCKDDYISQSNFCYTCQQQISDNCVTCQKITENQFKCTECKSHFFLVSSGCLQCAEECAECADTKTNCTECYSGMQLNDSNQCVQCSVLVHSECLQCSDSQTCIQCSSNYYVSFDNKCSKCDNSCLTCEGYGQFLCKTCDDNLYLVEKQCKSCQEIKGQQCTDCRDEQTCNNCIDGYILEQGDCLQCEQPCQHCIDSIDKCTKCIDNFLLNDLNECKVCQEYMTNACLECQNYQQCSKCADSYYLDENKICQKCDPQCQNCVNSADNCTSCSQYKIPTDEGCMYCNQLFQKCKSCVDQTECLECENNAYFDENKICQPCDFNCQTCEGSSDNCLSCKNINNIQSINNNCNCEVGYYKNLTDNQCSKCDEKCSECENSSKNCTKCSYGRDFEKDCQCETGKYEDIVKFKNVCLPCQKQCLTCDNYNFCIDCKITTPARIPEQNCSCPQGYLDSSDGNYCNAIKIDDKDVPNEGNGEIGEEQNINNCTIGCSNCSALQQCLACKYSIPPRDKNNNCQCVEGYKDSFDGSSCIKIQDGEDSKDNDDDKSNNNKQVQEENTKEKQSETTDYTIIYGLAIASFILLWIILVLAYYIYKNYFEKKRKNDQQIYYDNNYNNSNINNNQSEMQRSIISLNTAGNNVDGNIYDMEKQQQRIKLVESKNNYLSDSKNIDLFNVNNKRPNRIVLNKIKNDNFNANEQYIQKPTNLRQLNEKNIQKVLIKDNKLDVNTEKKEQITKKEKKNRKQQKNKNKQKQLQKQQENIQDEQIQEIEQIQDITFE